MAQVSATAIDASSECRCADWRTGLTQTTVYASAGEAAKRSATSYWSATITCHAEEREQ